MNRVKVKHKDSEAVIEIDRSQIPNANYYGWFEVTDEPAETVTKSKARAKDGKSKG